MITWNALNYKPTQMIKINAHPPDHLILRANKTIN